GLLVLLQQVGQAPDRSFQPVLVVVGHHGQQRRRLRSGTRCPSGGGRGRCGVGGAVGRRTHARRHFHHWGGGRGVLVRRLGAGGREQGGGKRHGQAFHVPLL